MADIIPLQFTSEQIQVMKQTVAPGVSNTEFAFFLEVCKSRGLNPFNREIYAIPRGNKITIQTSIDGLRILAERSGKYRGQEGPWFCGPDGQWREEWLLDEPPVAARVGVIRSDFDKPIYAVARYKAYVQSGNALWKSMPDVMLAKCCESLALRKAFPQAMAGLYTHEEMAQADGSPRISVPSLKALCIKAQDAGLLDDADAFYALCTDVLDRHITRDNGARVTIDERMHIAAAIDEAISNLHPAVVESEPVEQDGYVSLDEMSRELAEQKQSA